MILPKFVQTDLRSDWFPEHDSLLTADGDVLEDNNAYLFWQFNCRVRRAFFEIRQRIEAGEIFKITRKLLAKNANVQYVGLYNVRRRGWVMREIATLRKLQETLAKKKVLIDNGHKLEVKDLKTVIADLQQDKMNLSVENSILRQEKDKYIRLVKTQEQQLQRLKSIIEDKLSD